MRCGVCAHANAQDARFCAHCGTPLVEAVVCGGCGNPNADRQRFCGACGKALDAHNERSPLAAHSELLPDRPERPSGHSKRLSDRSERPPDRSERLPDHIVTQLLAHEGRIASEHKHVTVLFVDVKGSMQLSERIDAERWYTVMARFFTLLSDGIHRYEGRVDRFTGDGVMAVFGAPLAYEDHARRAAHAALHLRSELERYARELARDHEFELAVRMGLNSGEVVVGSIGDDLSLEYAAIGRTAGLAQRMEALAQPGTIAVSENTAKLIAGYFQLRELGAFEVKGARAAMRVCELIGTGSLQTPLELARARGLSRFVGREGELERLADALTQARAGQGQTVAIVGEAGIGKSRLAWEFVERQRSQGVEVWEAHGLAHAKALSFTPMLELLRAYFGIREQDDSPRVQALVGERLAPLASVLEDDLPNDLPLLLDFLGAPDPGHRVLRIDPEARRRQLFSAIGRLLGAQSQLTPIVLLVEDLHWLDAGSEAFLQSLIAGLGGTRILMVLTFRPEYAPPWSTAHDPPWSTAHAPPSSTTHAPPESTAHVRELRLAPLEPSVSEALLGDLLGADPSLQDVGELIAARALGNPFFCEELVAALIEAGVLIGERGAYRLGLPLEGIVVPSTLQATLAARIDRLGAEQKELLQVAAVIGYQLAEPLLRAVSGASDAGFDACVHALVAAELLLERPGEEDVEYSFRHPLTRDVAYNTQLADQRRRVHREVAVALERMSPHKLDERAALVALHWQAAGERLQAARWSARAAGWVGLRDIAEAAGHWQRVGELVQELPDSAETTALALSAHFWRINYGWRLRMSDAQAAREFEAGRELAAGSGNDISLLLITAVYAQRLGLVGRIDEHVALAAEVDRLSKRIGNPAVRLVALPSPLYALFMQGRLQEALALAEEGVALGADDHALGGEVAGLACPYAYCVMFKGWFLCLQGRLRESAGALEHALQAAREQHDLEVEAWTDLVHVILARYAGATEDTLAHATHGHEIATRIGSPFSRIWALFLLGEAHLLLGDALAAVSAIEQALALSRQERIGLEFEALRVARLSEALLGAGEPDLALANAEESLALALERHTVIVLPVSYRALADALLAGDDQSGQARAREALEQARSWVHTTEAWAELPFIERTQAKLGS